MTLPLTRRTSFVPWRRAGVVVLGLVAASAGLAPAQAAASPGWRIERYLPGNEAVENRLIFATGKSNAWTVAGGSFGTLDLAGWNGNAWHAVPTPTNLAGNNPATAEALAGSAANNMWLFGYGNSLAADNWTGSGWSQHVLTGLDSGFGVSAATVSQAGVWAFGAAPGTTTIGPPRALLLTGGKWRKVAMPGFVMQVSAPSAKDIWTLGARRASFTTINHWRMILMHWVRGKWRAVALPAVSITRGHPALALNFVALGPANVWAVAGATPNPCGCVAEPAGLVLEHWNGRRWTVTRLRKYGGVAGLASDGHGGFWFASSRGKTLVFVHDSDGKITSTPVPRGHGESVAVDGLASVPGTHSVWASGSLAPHEGHGLTGVVLKYGP